MKKKKKVTKRPAPRKSTFSLIAFFRKYFFLLIPALIVSGALMTIPKNDLNQNVLGAAVTSFRNSTVTWTSVPSAYGYNIYYKEQSATKYTFAARRIPSTSTRYTIQYLKEKTNYFYVISAYDQNGKEFWFSEQRSL